MFIFQDPIYVILSTWCINGYLATGSGGHCRVTCWIMYILHWKLRKSNAWTGQG